MPKKIPLRMCIVTREKLEKKSLIRVVRTPNKEVIIDETSKQNGKGAYLKRDLEVIKKARKSKVLDRALDIEVPSTIYDDLEKLIKEE